MLWGHGEQMCLWSVSWCCQINVLSLARVHAPALGCAKCLPLLRQITATLEATELFVHWKGWPCHMGLQSGEKNTSDVLIETFKILTLCIFPHLQCKWFLHSPAGASISPLTFSRGYLATMVSSAGLAGESPLITPVSSEKILTRYFYTGPEEGRSPAGKKINIFRGGSRFGSWSLLPSGAGGPETGGAWGGCSAVPPLVHGRFFASPLAHP